LGTIKWQFYVGIILAAVGATMATYFKPPPPAPVKPAATQTAAVPAPTQPAK
jgi:hypothetical protein